MPHSDDTTFPVSETSRIRRYHERGSHERQAVYAVLDASPICHVGYVIEDQPYVTPTLHWRLGDRIFWHGSSASRFLKQTREHKVCLTVTLIDGFVLARSAFNHSVNYRSAMVFGEAHQLTDPAEKEASLKAMTNDFYPGRWEQLRPITAQEIKATAVLFMDIAEASVKVRSGPPGDQDEADFPVWAGLVPLQTVLSSPKVDGDPDHAPPVLSARLGKRE